MTFESPSDVINYPLNLSRAQVKLFYYSLDNNSKTTEKINPHDVIPTISINNNQHLLVL